ncbi:MAG: hypothetical protein JXB30_01640 [Anaerolineae bacterium]|nr:hypothetical protein [Anaerolineae bacterium]
MKIIAYIAAAILIFFGVLFIWGAGGEGGGGWGWVLAGSISALIGFGLIWLASRKPAAESAGAESPVYKIDLPGKTTIEEMKCKSCGGALMSDNVKMVAGAPVVTCPFCNATYQLTEEPKW